QIVERRANYLPKPARGQPSLPDRLVNGNNPADLQRLRRLLLRSVVAAFARLSQNLELRLDDLQLSAARVLLDLPVQRDHLPRIEFVLQVGGMKPKAAQPGASLADGELKNRHAAGAEQPRVAHFPDHGRHLTRTQLRNAPRIQPVFIAKWQIMEQVADRVDPFGGKHFPDARSDALHVHHRSREFEHGTTVPTESRPITRARKRKNDESAGGNSKNGSRSRGRVLELSGTRFVLPSEFPSEVFWCLNHRSLKHRCRSTSSRRWRRSCWATSPISFWLRPFRPPPAIVPSRQTWACWSTSGSAWSLTG